MHKCPVCFSASVPLYRDMEDQQFDTAYPVDLFQCSNSGCGHVFVFPLPSLEEISSFYASYSTHDQWKNPSPLFRWYTSFVEKTCFFDDLSGQRSEYVTAGLLREDAKSVLDLGCGAGNLLISLKNHGWADLCGIDFDAAAVQAARLGGLDNVHVGGINDLPNKEGKFDYIVLASVVEHLADPLRDLLLARERLRPGGKIIIRTPNASSFLRKFYGRRWRGWEAPRHLNVFTLLSLERVAIASGLKVMELKTSNALLQSMVIESTVRIRRAGKTEIIISLLLNPFITVMASVVHAISGHKTGEEITAILIASEE